jgi:hypothetical protein
MQHKLDPVTATRHRAVLDELVHDAKQIEVREERLSRRDRSMANFLLASANAEATTFEMQVRAAPEPQSAGDLAPLEHAKNRLKQARARIEAGRPPVDERLVRVSVFAHGSSVPIKGLRVYVLPKDMLERPQLYPVELLKELLEDLTFETLTSPAQGRVPLSDIRIWVGPEHAYNAMCELVQGKRLHRYKPVHANATEEILELEFLSPEGVTLAGDAR